jgi:hypothetical protein
MIVLVVGCLLALLHESAALSFAAKIAEKNLDCQLQPTKDEATRVLSGALFGFAQLPNVIGWFASEFVVTDRTTVTIKPITDKRYPYLIVGGISTEPINRRLAVARDHGMDVMDFVSKKLLADMTFPTCVGSLSELQFDAASGNLYGLAFSTLAADGVSCTGKERELLIQVDYIANKLRIVAEPDACSINVGVSTFDYVKRHFYFQGNDCAQQSSNGGGTSGNSSFGLGAPHLYRVDVSDDAKSALGQAPVTRLPVPDVSVALIKWSQTAAAAQGTFFVMAQVNAPGFEFSLATLDPETGKVTKLSDKAHRAAALILNAPSTVDGPNNVLLIQNVEQTFDVLSLTTGEKLDTVTVAFNAADATGTDATLPTATGTIGVGTTTAAPSATSGADVNATTTGAGSTTPSFYTTTVAAPANNATPPAGGTTVAGASTAPIGGLATVGSIQLAPNCICCSRREELARPDDRAIMKKRNIAPLNEDLVKACDAAATPQATSAASSVTFIDIASMCMLILTIVLMN